MTMAHSNSMGGGVQKNLLAPESLEACSVLISHLASLSPRRSRLSSVLLFSYFSCNISFCTCLRFQPPPFIFSLMSASPFFPELSICVHLASRGFVICHSAAILLHPLPIIISHLIYFSSLPTTAFSICHPAPPSTRVPVCICMIFKKSEIVEPQ